MAEEEQNNSRIKPAKLGEQMRTSFLDYAMSVIVARALPDVRDGLKPVHRRILYGMNELGVTPDKQHKKSARIVGDVMGKYHPHGDSAIYESMVRMAQDFSYRYMLVDGHGNFGSVDGDPAAAMRYTEARLSKIATEMLRDINKDTIDFADNYDGTDREPVVLPARFPNLLVNGANGIAVGMATNIPPHNLGEVISAIHMLMNNPDVTTAELMEAVPGPDFPTGAIVMGKSGIRKAYETGKGVVTVRAKVEIETEKSGKERIIVTELPYMVNKAKLIERIAELGREKRIEGITAVNDESDQTGYRIAIDIRRDVSASVVLNNLYKNTLMQTGFSFNMLAVQDGRPKLLGLKAMLVAYLEHQQIVVRRRTEFELRKAEARAHILEGLRIALVHIDAIISIIRGSETSEIAKNRLMSDYALSDKQAQAILDMRLVRLTGLERGKIEEEYQGLMTAIADYKDILAKPERIDEIIYTELLEIQEKYGDERRTELQIGDVTSIEDEDLIEEEDIIVSLTSGGYIKRMAQTEFRAQNRGGRGVQGMGVEVVNSSFVSVVIPREMVAMVGLPQKEYFIWGDDIEYTNRIADIYRGYTVVKSVVVHKSKENTMPGDIVREEDAGRLWRYEYEFRNRMLTARRINKRDMLGMFKGAFRWDLRHVLLGQSVKFRMKKAGMIIKGSWRGLFFNPEIEFAEGLKNYDVRSINKLIHARYLSDPTERITLDEEMEIIENGKLSDYAGKSTKVDAFLKQIEEDKQARIAADQQK